MKYPLSKNSEEIVAWAACLEICRKIRHNSEKKFHRSASVTAVWVGYQYYISDGMFKYVVTSKDDEQLS